MVSDPVPMEGVSESCEEAKPKAGEEEVKKEQEVTKKKVGDDNMGSCKKGPDFLEEKGVHLWTSNPRYEFYFLP